MLELLRAILGDMYSTDTSSCSSDSISISHQVYDEPQTLTSSRCSKRHPDERQVRPTTKRTRSILSEADTEYDPDNKIPECAFSS
ncbi:hypothetical protein F4805DRAFT_450969 [Annulohypoxylon moriforme]|nr:hypothetical protein F4805DRAFT_450969 [Annulohypoxylon moriforme]